MTRPLGFGSSLLMGGDPCEVASAYTGAEREGRDGKFKVADGGTLFLDEFGDTPQSLQSKLLRVLQEQEIDSLGSNRIERVDVLTVSATSRDRAGVVRVGTTQTAL